MRLYHHNAPSENVTSFVSLARIVGISTELFDVQTSAAFVATMEEVPLGEGVQGLVFDVASLAAVVVPDDLIRVVTFLRNRKASVLLLTTSASQSADRFVEILTGGAVLKLTPVARSLSVHFPRRTAPLAAELVSATFPRNPTEALGLILCSRAEVDVVMTHDEFPSFVRTPVGQASVFVWSSLKVFDMLRSLAAETEFEKTADEYIPAIIFLRAVFGERCWHNPLPRAGFVIDDPLLNRRYGFIRFPDLLDSARTCGYRITLAFIPWNYWRSREKSVQRFLDYADCFSLCAHGCDHTRNEFRSADYQDLLGRHFVARQRMDRHEKRTGIPWEPLMVCPQEQYSLEGLRAFADSRQFLALVNSACMPREGSAGRLCGADLLLPAQDSYFGFPVFKRHYWNDISVFAMALFLGKPAILVEHHEFFRNGPGKVEEFASRLKQINPSLRWISLGETVIETHLRRRDEESQWQIRFFTDRFQFEHEGSQDSEYRLMRRIPATTKVQRVVVNQKEVPFLHAGDRLDFQVRVKEPQMMKVEIGVNPIQPAKACSSGLNYTTRVAARRGLSELRDNFVARNRFVSAAARSLMRSLKQTGGD